MRHGAAFFKTIDPAEVMIQSKRRCGQLESAAFARPEKSRFAAENLTWHVIHRTGQGKTGNVSRRRTGAQPNGTSSTADLFPVVLSTISPRRPVTGESNGRSSGRF